LSEGFLKTDLPGRLTYSGIGVYHADLFRGCVRGRFPLAPLIRAAADRGEVTGELFPGTWIDVGTPERLSLLRASIPRR
jgi:MurNAc alpha-1-phosphate uridylyltransferase